METPIDPFLVVGFIILLVVVFVINVYVLVYWQHPDDKNESHLVRILVVLGLQLSAVSVLLLPVDVANGAGNPECDQVSLLSIGSSAYCGGVDMYLCWDVLFNMLYFVLIVLLPLATFYYEAEDSDIVDPSIKKSRFLSALCYESVVVIFCLVLLLALFYSNRPHTRIPVETQKFNVGSLTTTAYIRVLGESPYSYIDQTITQPLNIPQSTETAYISYPLSFSVYIITLFSWMGWWLFAIFCGVGLCALPFDFITMYIYRPRPLAPDEVVNIELELSERTQSILETATELKKDRCMISTTISKKQARQRFLNDRIQVNLLNQMAFILERDIAELGACKTIMISYNPLLPLLNLAAGIGSAVISILWVLQIILSILTDPPVSQFLSDYLMWFDTWFPMFGTVSYALFSLYLCFCTLAGSFKLGLRVPFCKIHPIKFGGTYMNSFLFNIGILLLCTASLVQFCAVAFAGYTVYSDIYLLFNVQITNADFFSLFYRSNVFVWLILLCCCVTVVWLLMYPRDTPAPTTSWSGERRMPQKPTRDRKERQREGFIEKVKKATAKESSSSDYGLIGDREQSNPPLPPDDSGTTFIDNGIEMADTSPLPNSPTALAVVSTEVEYSGAGHEEFPGSHPSSVSESIRKPAGTAVSPIQAGTQETSTPKVSNSAWAIRTPTFRRDPADSHSAGSGGLSKFMQALRSPFSPAPPQRPQSAVVENFSVCYERPKSGFADDLDMIRSSPRDEGVVPEYTSRKLPSLSKG